jgi:hypothetical protein
MSEYQEKSILVDTSDHQLSNRKRKISILYFFMPILNFKYIFEQRHCFNYIHGGTQRIFALFMHYSLIFL